MCRITTISGRSIIVSTDHKFMTDLPGSNPKHVPAEWKDSRGFMKRVTRVGIFPTTPVKTTVVGSKLVPSMGALILARVIGYYRARPSLGFDTFDDEARYKADVQLYGFDAGHRSEEFIKYAGEFPNLTKWLDGRSSSEIRALIISYLSGYISGAKNETDAKAAVDFAAAFLGEGVNGIPEEEIGYVYKRRAHIAMAKQAEYRRHVQFMNSGGGAVMTWEEFDAAVGARNDMLMVPVLAIEQLPMLEIVDIEVESDNHSFIGGEGFAVSNSAMGKQAVGVYASNFNSRTDTMAHVLHYPQKPLTQTQLSKYVNNEQLPSGINAIVAIMTYTGFNQEDSVMVNKSALDRGLFTTTYFKSYRDQCSKNHSTGEEEVFMKPATESGAISVDANGNAKKAKPKPFNYDKLGADGFVPKNTYVDSSDILVGKVMPHKGHGAVQYRDTSMQMKGNDTGYIDMNYTGVNGDGYKFCKVRLRTPRKPMVGDKLASRHAQKGTIGMVYSEADMPFTKDGIRPDVIMNPHAVPSRMTIAQLMECIMGKAACGIGACGDCTPFTGCTVESIATVLERSGYERYGNEILYNGRTGQQIQTEIFIGPTYYQRLKHMVSDKVHSRSSNGPIVFLTRQPAEGRARNGGLRFGEMERDVLIGHGMSLFLKERMLDVSDNFRVFPCRKCGLISVANPEKNIYHCGSCNTSADTAQIRLPYAMSLLLRELESMSVGVRLCL
jgi:DNA-directed RNA polymerase beta subunit